MCLQLRSPPIITLTSVFSKFFRSVSSSFTLGLLYALIIVVCKSGIWIAVSSSEVQSGRIASWCLILLLITTAVPPPCLSLSLR